MRGEKAVIEVKNITKRYGGFVAVDDISFEIDDNEVVGFLGPNGAGKSTTMNMITGYIEPTKGKIIVNGYDISKSPIKAKKQIGYMPENVPLYNDLTVKEFVKYMAELKEVNKKEIKDEVEKVIVETGLQSVENKLIKNISRGYKQRTSMAGALVGNPKVLILDEPTVGLDPKQITEIRKLIKDLGKNHTVILSSHILSEVSQICEKVIIINKGKILAVDTPENLENETKSDSSFMLCVEDKEKNMKNIKNKIKGATEVELLTQHEDGTERYLISGKNEEEIRKQIIEVLPKNKITIFEMIKSRNTLEDAFLKIIKDKEMQVDIANIKAEKRKNQRKKELESMTPEERKLAIKSDKKKAKEEREESFNKEWEKEKAIQKAEKEHKKELKEKRKSEKAEEKKLKKERKEKQKQIKAKEKGANK